MSTTAWLIGWRTAAAVTVRVLIAGPYLVTIAAGQVTYDTRALSGDNAPGTETGVVFNTLNNAAINDEGEVAFSATLAGGSVGGTNDSGVWSDDGGMLGLIAREGDPAPGTETGVVFSTFGNPLHSGTGQVAFLSFLTGVGVSSANDRGIWAGTPGSLDLVAREGGSPPGTGTGAVYSVLGNPVLNDSGDVAFNASISGPGVTSTNDSGNWSESGGALGLVAREGDPAPDTSTGVVFSTIFNPTFNGAGQTAFAAFLAGPGVVSTNDSAVWSEGSGSLGLVARENHPAPGTETGVVFSFFASPTLNDAGDAAFRGFVTGAGVTATNDAGVWSEGSPLGLRVREGDPAPGFGPGVVISTVSDVPLNGSGDFAFIGILAGPGIASTNDNSLWVSRGGSLDIVGRENDPAPGTGTGVVHGVFFLPAMNAAGQVVFVGTLTGAGVTGDNDRGVWMTDPSGTLHLVVREGDAFDINDDPASIDLRTVSAINIYTGTGGQDGKPVGLNDAGQLAIRLNFTDGSTGIFVAEIAAAAPAAPILDIVVTGGLAEIRFDTEVGFDYHLQTNAVMNGTWSNRGDAVAGSGSNESVPVPAAGDEQYFRVDVE